MDAKQVAAARAELGLSMEQFGAALGVARTTVMRWERGTWVPPRLAELAIQRLLSEKKVRRRLRNAGQAAGARP